MEFLSSLYGNLIVIFSASLLLSLCFVFAFRGIKTGKIYLITPWITFLLLVIVYSAVTTIQYFYYTPSSGEAGHALLGPFLFAWTERPVQGGYDFNVEEEYEYLDLVQCGYKSCTKTKKGMLNVHLVPHTHDDVGWLKTVDEYYNGLRNEFQNVEIRKIINNVIDELEKDPRRRFIYVETAFFWRWWEEVDDKKKERVRALVNLGQLEFVSGGWCMNDEATAHYNAIIDQFTLGLRFLNDTFGPCGIPRAAWQIDPFGHSKENAAISAAMGFDGLFFARLHYQDKEKRMKDREMETMWSSDDKNRGEDAHLFTSVLFNGYEPPQNFCFDTYFCGEAQPNATTSPKVKDKVKGKPAPFLNKAPLKPFVITDENFKDKMEEFEAAVEKWAKAYRSGHILIPMGSDFHYQNAKYWYDNMDKLIKGINSKQNNGGKLHLLYSTPSCYLQAIHNTESTWSVKKDDFFPYESVEHDTWAGYFTSRPTFKFYVHNSNNFLQACKQLASMTTDDTDDPSMINTALKDIFVMDEAMGIVQHHDAVTGTSRQHVHDDYSKSIHTGVLSCQKVVGKALMKMENSSHSYNFCPLLNISICDVSEQAKSSFVISVYNPLARQVSNSYIRLPVSSKYTWKVEGVTGEIKSQLVPIPAPVFSIPGRNGGGATSEIVFPAGVLPGLTLSNFKVIPSITKEEGGKISRIASDADEKESRKDFTIKNSMGVELTLDGITGLPKKLKNGQSEIDLTQNFHYYDSNGGDDGHRPSGAYIFRPDGELKNFEDPPYYKVHKGDQVTEVHVTVSDYVSQVIRLYDKSLMVEFEWIVGPIPDLRDFVFDGKSTAGTEVIVKFTSNLATNKTFYTDSNGRQMVKRVRDHQDTWNYKVNEKVSGNYYPINSRIILTEGKNLGDNQRTLILMNDRSQGGSSLKDGEVEIMLNRRCYFDDNLGLPEPLNEKAFGEGLVARGKIWLVLAGEGTGQPNSIHRPLAQEIFMSRLLAFREPSSSVEKFSASAKYSKLAGILPKHCHLLTLQKLSADQILIRFEHLYEKEEDEYLSENITISFEKLKEVLSFKSIRETTLGANQWKNEATRLSWNIKNMENEKHPKNSELKSSRKSELLESDIILTPFEIRTFIVSL